MGKYRLQGDTYIIERFDELPAFSSFLPGLAGIKGIPLWVYYTNRGQGINSFGIHHKGNAIMEFNPANTAYENTALKGYRTFIKCNGDYFEPFFSLDKTAQRNLYIRKNSVAIEEINERFGLKINIKYYVLPKDNIGALVRKVTVENISGEAKDIEMVDGLPKIIPYGIQNGAYKEMSNLLRSWTEIKNIDNKAPYYTMRASSDDSAEVSDVEGGYFYLSVHEGKVQDVIYDPEVIFGYETSLVYPVEFLDKSLQQLLEKSQCFYNKIPSGFTPYSFTLSAGASFEFNTMTGFAASPDQINEKLDQLSSKKYLAEKELEADELVNALTADVKTSTARPIFDQYIEQNYMDNFLRGGYPFVFNKDTNKAVVHLFSRKHGDPERDYNFFSIAGEYYSQGNGNFRDVNQNRRNDVFFKKEIGDFNIKTFFQLIQIDGFNPLEVRPSTFTVKPEQKEQVSQLLKDNIKDHSEKIERIVGQPFTPGQVANGIARFHIDVTCGEDTFLEKLLSYCDQNIEAGFGEGYWSDHWDYNMDLVENYLSIFPDHQNKLLFDDQSYRYYDSAARVLPRSDKYVINSRNEVRQYGALVHDDEKAELTGFKKNGTNWLKTAKGEYLQTSLMAKMITLALNKFSALDSYGMGVEMEGGKPGWNDAMNGLPGIFGSGMPETFELKRLVSFISNAVTGKDKVALPVEVGEFLTKVAKALSAAKAEGWSNFRYWDTVTTYREQFRDEVRYGTSGELAEFCTKELSEIFLSFEEKIQEGIKQALNYGKGIIPTYFTFKATDFEPVVDEKGNPVNSHYGLPKAKVNAFEVQPLPYFLEAPAKMLSTMKDVEGAKALYSNVKSSDLFDKKLGMYKTSVPIEHLSMENGRIRAFTPGWLERESIFLHMEYKYLLSLLKAGLYDEFFHDIQTGLVVFRDPSQYGRSILENSSFLASSENPNSEVHGRGFQARLSGSTTETMTMWIKMFMGDRIFTFENEELQLHFEPKLPGWMFDEKGDASFTFMSTCKVTYHNPAHKATYGEQAARISSIVIEDTKEIVKADVLSGDLAEAVREGRIKEITVNME